MLQFYSRPIYNYTKYYHVVTRQFTPHILMPIICLTADVDCLCDGTSQAVHHGRADDQRRFNPKDISDTTLCHPVSHLCHQQQPVPLCLSLYVASRVEHTYPEPSHHNSSHLQVSTLPMSDDTCSHVPVSTLPTSHDTCSHLPVSTLPTSHDNASHLQVRTLLLIR